MATKGLNSGDQAGCYGDIARYSGYEICRVQPGSKPEQTHETFCWQRGVKLMSLKLMPKIEFNPIVEAALPSAGIISLTRA